MDHSLANTGRGSTQRPARDDRTESLTIAMWAVNVNQRCAYFAPACESATQNSWQFHRTLHDFEHYVQVAASDRADVFVCPEYLFAQNLHRRKGLGKVDDRYKYSFGYDEYRELECCLWILSRSYPWMLIVAGTILWTDRANLCRNTCLIAKGGVLSAYHKMDLETEESMMRCPLNDPNNKYEPVHGTRPYCQVAPEDDDLIYHIQICRDFSVLRGNITASSAQVLIIPAYGLGGVMPSRNNIVIVCDGASASHIYVDAADYARAWTYQERARRRVHPRTLIPLGAGLKIVRVAMPEALEQATLQRQSERRRLRFQGPQKTRKGSWEI